VALKNNMKITRTKLIFITLILSLVCFFAGGLLILENYGWKLLLGILILIMGNNLSNTANDELK